MKKTLLSIVTFGLLVCFSCKAPMELPKNLSKSRLLVLKYQELPEPENGGLKKWGVSRYNKTVAANNIKLEKAFIKYPFDYKLVTEEEIADNMAGAETVYVLKNGKTSVTAGAKYTRVANMATGSASSGGSNDKKTEVVLENLTLHRKKVLGKFRSGTAKMAPDFVKAAKKIAPKKKLPAKKKK